MLCAIDFDNLHTVLRSLYDEMMPLCGDMAGVAQGEGGLGGLVFVCLFYTPVAAGAWRGGGGCGGVGCG